MTGMLELALSLGKVPSYNFLFFNHVTQWIKRTITVNKYIVSI